MLDPLSHEVRNFISELEEAIEKLRNGLERRGKSHEDLIYMQGQIKAYRNVIEKLRPPQGDDDE